MSRFLGRFWGQSHDFDAASGEGGNGVSRQGAASWIEINDPLPGTRGEPVMKVDQATIDGVLLPLGNKEPVNVVAIFGAARGGKSFLMNQLAGRDDVFKISNEKVSRSYPTCSSPRLAQTRSNGIQYLI